MAEKKYGLIIPKKAQLSAPKSGNIFGDDNDSEEEGTDWVKKALKGEYEKNKVKKQTKINMKKALEQDPTIYEYDEVYDEMERIKEEEKAVKTVDRKPKYIANLLKTAEKRKIENELRIERQVQKELEAEGETYKDKESFVTSSYKAKLEEFKKLKEEEERMDRLEAIGDVTKQKDLSGFYRHLYRQTFDKTNSNADNSKSETKKEKMDTILKPDLDKDESLDSDSSKNSESEAKKQNTLSSCKSKNVNRQYRKRNYEDSDSESESEQEKDVSVNPKPEPKKEKTPENTTDKKIKIKEENKTEDKSKTIPKEENKENLLEDSKIKEPDPVIKNKVEKNVKKESEPKIQVPKVSIYEKRTVGSILEAALERYEMRKKMRLAG